MRIGIDGLLLHGRYSGVEHSVEQLLQALSARSDPHEYLVYVGRDVPRAPWQSDRVRPRPLPIPARARLLRVAATHALLHRRAEADGVEVLHGPGYVLPRGWRGAAVLTLYDLIALAHPRYCRLANRLYYRRTVPRSARAAGAVVVPSAVVRADVVRTLGVPEAKVHVVPLGVRRHMQPADAEAVEVVRRRYELPERYGLFVGNAEPKKNLEQTLAGYHRAVLRSEATPPLVLAGGKAWGPQGAVYTRPAYAGEIRWALPVGYVADADLPALYTGASFVLLWSLTEGFGLPALEAMACGTPVICSDGGALPEVVGDAAEVVPLGDTSALAEAIVRLAQDEDRRQELIARGRARAARFTWEAHADRVVALYEEVGPRGRSR